MIPRYANENVDAIWTNMAKLLRWDQVELAVLEARMRLGAMDAAVFEAISAALAANPPDVKWWLARDTEIHHDLNAYLDERRRHIPVGFQQWWHKDMTSFDTEEAAFLTAIMASVNVLSPALNALELTLMNLAKEHRYTLLLARTHGQGAKLSTFGVRALGWYEELHFGIRQFSLAVAACHTSRLSGAVGNYGGNLTPELERTALQILGFEPFYGATQIMPRVVYAPIPQAMRLLAEALNKIANDLRLSARSGLPLWHEPFAKKQKGSSAMPHKKNPINLEQIEGLLRLVVGCESALVANIRTWEERAIEQSCVERVAWPDIFHLLMRMVTVMTRMLGGLVVYPDNMLQEIVDSRGTYASDEVKNWLAQRLCTLGEDAETAYRIVQLASFVAFKPDKVAAEIRALRPQSLEEAEEALGVLRTHMPHVDSCRSIEEIIRFSMLEPVAALEATEEEVDRWCDLLATVFSMRGADQQWHECFRPAKLLPQVDFLFREALGV